MNKQIVHIISGILLFLFLSGSLSKAQDTTKFIQNFYTNTVSVITSDSIGGLGMVFIGTITPTLLETQMILDYNYVGDSTFVLIYSLDSSYFTSGVFMSFTGNGILDSVDASTYLGVMITSIFEVITGVEDEEPGNLPSRYTLYQNYPNPFNSGTNIDFTLERSTYVNLEVYDITGRMVGCVFEGNLQAGEYSFYWEASDWSGRQLPSGVYLYRLRGDDVVLKRKLLLLK